MTVFPYPELDAEKEAEYKLLPINLTRMMLHTQGLTVPYWKYGLSFRNAKIPPLLREQVIVRVGAVADCNTNWFNTSRKPCGPGPAQSCWRT
jgi:hypothetical protein